MYIRYKGFEFPISVKTFSMDEQAKVATYEYAGRNGAEHERVLNYRIFRITGIFTRSSGTESPRAYINRLRLLNDNEPGELFHPDFGAFQCIIQKLSISQNADEFETDGNSSVKDDEGIVNYLFEMELWEHTDPSSATITDFLKKLFPASVAKPPSDDYATRLKYPTVALLFRAIKLGKIVPGTDPIRNAEWLRYDYDFRAEAYALWLDYLENGDTTATTIETSNQRTYTVQPGDMGLTIAYKFSVAFTDLFELNRGQKVRTIAKGSEGLYWKSANLLYVGDILLLPDKAIAPKITRSIPASASTTNEEKTKQDKYKDELNYTPAEWDDWYGGVCWEY